MKLQAPRWAVGLQRLTDEGKKRYGHGFDMMTLKSVKSEKAIGICTTKDGKKHQVTIRF